MGSLPSVSRIQSSSNLRPGVECPAGSHPSHFPRVGFLRFYNYFGLNSPDSSLLPAPPAQMLFLHASLRRFCPLCPWGVLARLAGRAGQPWGLSVTGVPWSLHVLWAQTTWGLSQLAVGAWRPWKNTDLFLSRKGLAGGRGGEGAHCMRGLGLCTATLGAPGGLPYSRPLCHH